MKQQMHISTASLLDHNIMTVDTKVLVELKYSACEILCFMVQIQIQVYVPLAVIQIHMT